MVAGQRSGLVASKEIGIDSPNDPGCSAVHRSPRGFFLSAALLLAVLTALAIAPVGRVQFDANPRTLEPKNSRAGIALRTIQAKMPAVAEPLILLVEGTDAQNLHDRWERLKIAR